MKKDYTILKWICGTIMVCCALIMFFSIFPHELTITLDTSDGVDRMINVTERIAEIQSQKCDELNESIMEEPITFPNWENCTQIPCPQNRTGCLVYHMKCDN